MTPDAWTPSRGPQDGPLADVDALVVELGRRGFDPRRPVLLTYLLELGADREGAYAVRDRAAADGWQATLYGDQTGWVVRVLRVGPSGSERLRLDARYVEDLARACGGVPRGVCVEDLREQDVGLLLVAVAGEPGPPAADVVPRVPAPRRPAAVPACRPARSA